MKRTLFLLSIGLLLALSACKEVVPGETTDMSAPSDSVLPEIPERPTEIEILDLTDEVELFVVVAGAYSAASGAQKKADALKKLGFMNADVIQRPGSKLYSALVERFDSESSAKAFAYEIASNNEIKSYVYKLDD